MQNSESEPSLDDLQVAIAATLYHQYRLAGAPYGDTYPGYQMWVRTSVIEPFRQLCDRHKSSQHKVGSFTCGHCGHTWVAVRPVQAAQLQCPACGGFTPDE